VACRDKDVLPEYDVQLYIAVVSRRTEHAV
jgi:hypothetical protein